MTPAEREEFEERAAICEYDGKLPRVEAERIARQCLERSQRLPLDDRRGEA